MIYKYFKTLNSHCVAGSVPDIFTIFKVDQIWNEVYPEDNIAVDFLGVKLIVTRAETAEIENSRGFGNGCFKKNC